MTTSSFNASTALILSRARWLIFFILASGVWGADSPLPENFQVQSFIVEGDNPLSAIVSDAVLAPFLGPSKGIEGLQAAAKALEAKLQATGYGLYTVALPPQELNGGVHLKVVPRPVAVVSVVSSDPVKDAEVRRALPALREGETPNIHGLARSLELANENSARQMTVSFSQSAIPGSVDAKIDVQKRSPWSASMRLDNSGNEQPAKSRLSTALSCANFLGYDQSVTVSYITSPEAWSDVKQYGGFYKVPIYPLAGSFSGYWFHSSVNSGTVADLFNISGSGRFYGVSYTQHLLAIKDWQPTLEAGIDDKVFGDDSTFFGRRFGGDVRSRPLTLAFAARKLSSLHNAGFSLSYSHNLNTGENNSTEAYAGTRLGAKRDWSAWRASADFSWQFQSRFILAARTTAQWSTQPLIGGEQFGFGGQDSVRALETRQVLGDSGAQASVELWLPSWRKFALLGFLDGGSVSRQKSAPGTKSTEDALAVGLGLRGQVFSHASISIDYGHLLDGVSGVSRGSHRLYAALGVQF